MGAYVEPGSQVDLRRHDNSRPANFDTEGMMRISGGTFRMGSDKRCPEESPVHRVTVDCRRYRPAARHAQPVDTLTSHVGFRCVIRERNMT